MTFATSLYPVEPFAERGDCYTAGDSPRDPRDGCEPPPMPKIKKIGVLTGGGDAPGLNAGSVPS